MTGGTAEAIASASGDWATLFGSGTPAGMTDAQLLGRFLDRRRDDPASAEAAFAAIVARHGGMVRSACRGVLGHDAGADADADDAAQAAFFVLARRGHAIRKAESLGPWLHGVAMRAAKRSRRDAARRRDRERKGAESAMLSRDADIPAAGLSSDDRRAIHEELDRLPGRYRSVLVLCHLEGLTHESAASVLRCPVRTVQTRLRRGRDRLRSRLARRGLAPSLALAAVAWSAEAASALAMAAPPAWARSTAHASLAYASGGAVASPAVAALARGVIRTMMFSHVKFAVAGTLIASALAAALPLLAPAVPAARPEDRKLAIGPDAPDVKPGTFEVVVVADDTNKPLPRAEFDVNIDLKGRRARADDSGRLVIDLAGRRIHDSVSFDVWADGYVQQRRRFERSDPKYPRDTGRVEVRLLPANETLGGTVRDESGRPIPGVTVAVWGYLGEKKHKDELAYRVVASTDDQGRWRAGNFRKMTFAYLYLDHPDFLSDGSIPTRTFGSPEGRTPHPKELAPLRDFSDVQVMKRGVAIRGRVADRRGRPIPGASVAWLKESERMGFGNDLPATLADAEGRFTIPHVPPGDLVLVARARGHAPEIVPIAAKADAKETEIVLPPAKTLSGVVVDGQDRPIEGVFVNVDTWRGFRGLGVFLATDKDGRFSWDDAPEDPVLVNVSKRGRLGTSMRPVRAGDPIRFTLKRSVRVEGTVRDAESDAKIDQCEIEVGTIDPKTGEVRWVDANQMSYGSLGLPVWASGGDLHAELAVEPPVSYRFRLKHPGHEPFTTREIKPDEGEATIDVKLARIKAEGMELSGEVVDPVGKPVAGAQVAIVKHFPEGWIDLVGGKFGRLRSGRGGQDSAEARVTTDSRGRFTLPGAAVATAGPKAWVVVAHDRFYGYADREQAGKTPRILAKPWGRIEGVARVGTKPLARREVRCFRQESTGPQLSGDVATTTDDQGRFAFDRVPPGTSRVGPVVNDENGHYNHLSDDAAVDVVAGETARVQVGGMGRPIVAKIVVPEGFDPKADYAKHSEFEVATDKPVWPIPKELLKARDESMSRWIKRFDASPEGRAYHRAYVTRSRNRIGADGTIRLDDLAPGDYVLKLTMSADPLRGRGRSPDRVVHATRQFTIPAIPGGRSDEPMDLGTIHPQVKKVFNAGEQAPGFAIKTVDGKPLSLADFKGKVVLIDFWATWCGPCLAELPELKAVRDRFKGDDRFVMLSLSLDAEAQAPRDFAAKNGLDWVQGFLGDWSETPVPDLYHVEAIPSVFLIGPDGRFLAQGLSGDAIGDAVAAALKR